MAGKQNKTSKKQRTPRVVANPKVVNRTGGRKPQARTITNPDRVKGIRNKLKGLVLERLAFNSVDLGWTGTTYLDLIVGLKNNGQKDQAYTDFMGSIGNGESQLVKPVQEAFVYAFGLVPDAMDIFPLPPGRTEPFFNEIKARKDKQAAEDKEARRRSKARKNHAGLDKVIAASGKTA